METVIKWRGNDDKWHVFDLSEIKNQSRNHAIRLFSGNIQVVAKQGEIYIVNREELRDKYQAKGAQVKLFGELERSEGLFKTVGLL